MIRWILPLLLCAAPACGNAPCLEPGRVAIDVTGTFQVDANATDPPCWNMGDFLSLPEPLHATIEDDGTWTFDDASLSVVLYEDDCLFTLTQRIDATDFTDTLSYIMFSRPATDVWQGSGVLHRLYANDATCGNRIGSVAVTLTYE
jgi:hypothetical protein